MACALSHLPGFGLVHGNELLAHHIDRARRCLTNRFGAERLSKWEQNHLIRWCGHFEQFPAELVNAYCGMLFHPAAIYSCDHQCVFIDASAVDRHGFVSHVFAALGIVTVLRDSRILTTDFPLDILNCSALRFPQLCDREIAQILSRKELLYYGRSPLHEAINLVFSILAQIDMDPALAALAFKSGKQSRLKNALNNMGSASIFDLYMFVQKAIERLSRHPSIDLAFLPEILLRPDFTLRIADYELPDPGQLFRATREAMTDKSVHWHVFPVPFHRGDRCEPALWTLTGEDVINLRDHKADRDLSDISLRPHAQVQARSVPATGPKIAEPDVFAIHAFRADLLHRETAGGCIFPLSMPSTSCLCRIASLTVGRNLSWAVIGLDEPNSKKPPILALCTTWSHQGALLPLFDTLRVDIAFWASSLKVRRALKRDRLDVLSQEGEFPHYGITGTAIQACEAGELFGTPITRIVLRRDGRELTVYAPHDTHDPMPTEGAYIECEGLFLAGSITIAGWNPKANRTDVLEAIGSAPRGRQALRRKALVSGLRAGDPALLAAYAETYRSQRGRKRLAHICSLQSWAASHGNRRAMRLQLKLLLEHEKHPVHKSQLITSLLIAGALGDTEALFDAAYHTRLRSNLGQDVIDCCLRRLAALDNHAPSMCHLAKAVQETIRNDLSLTEAEKTTFEMLSFSHLYHAAVQGNIESVYSVCQMLCQGIGTEVNLVEAHALLSFAASRGDVRANYWLGMFSLMQGHFFTASAQEKLNAIRAQLSDASPPTVMLLTSFYDFDESGDPDARLMCVALYNWIADVMNDASIRQVGQERAQQLTEQESARLPLFNPWDHIGIEEPPSSVPLLTMTTTMERELRIHEPFLRSLDSCEDSPEGLERFGRTLQFFADNSTDILLGYARDRNLSPPDNLRLSAFDYIEGSNGFLLVASFRETPSSEWTVGGIYPYFTTARAISVTVQAAAVSESGEQGMLFLRPELTGSDSIMMSAFDPLWPLMSEHYLVGERFTGYFYGVGFTLEKSKEPAEFLRRIKAGTSRSEDAWVNLENGRRDLAQYVITTRVREIVEEYATIAGTCYTMLGLDPFTPAESEGASHFPVYVTQNLVESAGEISLGDWVCVRFEFHVRKEDNRQACFTYPSIIN